jgi:hypothetical protein
MCRLSAPSAVRRHSPRRRAVRAGLLAEPRIVSQASQSMQHCIFCI